MNHYDFNNLMVAHTCLTEQKPRGFYLSTWDARISKPPEFISMGEAVWLRHKRLVETNFPRHPADRSLPQMHLLECPDDYESPHPAPVAATYLYWPGV